MVGEKPSLMTKRNDTISIQAQQCKYVSVSQYFLKDVIHFPDSLLSFYSVSKKHFEQKTFSLMPALRKKAMLRPHVPVCRLT